jgi:hypothetical protein
MHMNPTHQMQVVTDKQKIAKNFMQRIVNGFGLAEISDTQCAGCHLGMRSMVSTDGHWFAYTKAGWKYNLQLLLMAAIQIMHGGITVILKTLQQI